ncbi:MAG: hypothetical protein Q4F00_12980 [bacterium]|nr:hypothetical protein [bacterium]
MLHKNLLKKNCLANQANPAKHCYIRPTLSPYISISAAVALTLLLSGTSLADCAAPSHINSTIHNNSRSLSHYELAQADSLPAPYQPVLKKYRAAMDPNAEIEESDNYGLANSLHEMRSSLSGGNRTYGYFLKDLNFDGVPELLIGANPGYGFAENATDIIGIYTIADGKADCVCCGWSRSNYNLTSDCKIAHFGSSGASNCVAVQYVLQGRKLHVQDGVRMMDAEGGHACYRLSGDDLYAQPAEKNAISDQEYYRFSETLAKKARLLKLTPLS